MKPGTNLAFLLKRNFYPRTRFNYLSTMKRCLLLLSFSIAILALISWGFTGHRTVALIAEKHLAPYAKDAVADLLKGESLASISTWADEIRNKPENKGTAPWHFINLPLGLSKSDFDKAVNDQGNGNLYTALKQANFFLGDSKTPIELKIESLKFLVHFVGDAHQPMHVSRAQDKGGNTIQLQFDGKGTNLHSLWDSKLLDKQGLSDVQLAADLDKGITPDQIKRWENDEFLDWLYESYQISSQLYSEVKNGSKLNDAYYKKHISTVNEQIAKAGIRLAYILNRALMSYKPSGQKLAKGDSDPDYYAQRSTGEKAPIIELSSLASHIGDEVTVSGKVYGFKDLGSMVLVNVGAVYPNQLLTVVLRGKAKAIAKEVDGKQITIIGKISEYKGKPQIEVSDPKMVIVQPMVGGSGRKGG